MQSGAAAAWGAACPVHVRLRGARLLHVATPELSRWWGGPAQLDEAYALYYKGFYLEQLSRLLHAHLIRGDGVDGVQPTVEERAYPYPYPYPYP